MTPALLSIAQSAYYAKVEAPLNFMKQFLCETPNKNFQVGHSSGPEHPLMRYVQTKLLKWLIIVSYCPLLHDFQVGFTQIH